MSKLVISLAMLSVMSVSVAGMSFAQEDDEIVVTGAKVRTGGAQDIKHFRGEVDRGSVPSPKGMTSEGLLNQHDLYLTSNKACNQILCINSAAKPATFLDADYFVGLGFDTNIATEWERPSLNLVAVIDRSGSMGGRSIENVKQSLHAIKGQLRDGDQISFILYGSDVVTHLHPLKVTEISKTTISEKIDSILVEGSTNMDAGLGRAYDIAHETKAEFSGITRVMIFTDERPNTGRTDADGFMARAQRASRAGVGLTTIGYGVNYGGELAAKIASVRGGNLFYVGNKSDVETLFEKEFDFMVSEVAHDMSVNLKPANGLKVGQVYGVPQDMYVTNEDGSVTMSVATVFMSSEGGGLFASLEGSPALSDQPLFQAELKYTQGSILRRSQSAPNSMSTSSNLEKAEALSAQYSAMKAATTAFYERDYDSAHRIFSGFAEKFSARKLEGLEEEYKMVAALNKTLAIEAGELDGIEDAPKYALLRGEWEVTRAGNMEDVHRGDRFIFSANSATHYRKSKGFDKPYLEEYYRVNDEQIYLNESNLTFRYSFNKDGRLRLRHRDRGTFIYLKPYESPEVSGGEQFNSLN